MRRLARGGQRAADGTAAIRVLHRAASRPTAGASSVALSRGWSGGTEPLGALPLSPGTGGPEPVRRECCFPRDATVATSPPN